SIAGLRVGDAGRVRVHGIDPWSDRDAIVRVLGIQLQESKLQPKITVKEALELWSAFYEDPLPWRDLAGKVGLSEHLDRRFAQLSGGQQQRLSIALALVGRPRVAVLDELSTGLDPRARREVWKLVRSVQESGITVLLVTHSMEEAQRLCDRLAIIDGGRILAHGTPEEVMRAAGASTLEAAYLDLTEQADDDSDNERIESR
ncbi:ABC transporter ATP-binding protein, partial [Pseudactinotalea sp.]|uniref:ABC transporter ATP-binding protein n=1 Tax=Pseudactinotalea sp. TaxID=1926260 RepID=UPI003B3A28BE